MATPAGQRNAHESKDTKDGGGSPAAPIPERKRPAAAKLNPPQPKLAKKGQPKAEEKKGTASQAELDLGVLEDKLGAQSETNGEPENGELESDSEARGDSGFQEIMITLKDLKDLTSLEQRLQPYDVLQLKLVQGEEVAPWRLPHEPKELVRDECSLLDAIVYSVQGAEMSRTDWLHERKTLADRLNKKICDFLLKNEGSSSTFAGRARFVDLVAQDTNNNLTFEKAVQQLRKKASGLTYAMLAGAAHVLRRPVLIVFTLQADQWILQYDPEIPEGVGEEPLPAVLLGRYQGGWLPLQQIGGKAPEEEAAEQKADEDARDLEVCPWKRPPPMQRRYRLRLPDKVFKLWQKIYAKRNVFQLKMRKLIIIGRQDVGKSTFTEFVAGIPFNMVKYGSGLGTRRPIELSVMYDATADVPMCTVQDGEEGKVQDVPHDKLPTRVRELNDIIEKRSPTGVTADYLHVKIRSKDVHMNTVLVDMPGMRSRDAKKEKEDKSYLTVREEIVKMIANELRNPLNQVVLFAAASEDKDASNTEAINAIHEANEYFRSRGSTFRHYPIVILTHLDTFQRKYSDFTLATEELQRLLKSYPPELAVLVSLRHKSMHVRNPTYEQRTENLAKIKEQEAEDDVWLDNLHSQRGGRFPYEDKVGLTAALNLVEYVQHQMMTKDLPDVASVLSARQQSMYVQIDRLSQLVKGPSEKTVQSQVSELIPVLARFTVEFFGGSLAGSNVFPPASPHLGLALSDEQLKFMSSAMNRLKIQDLEDNVVKIFNEKLRNPQLVQDQSQAKLKLFGSSAVHRSIRHVQALIEKAVAADISDDQLHNSVGWIVSNRANEPNWTKAIQECVDLLLERLLPTAAAYNIKKCGFIIIQCSEAALEYLKLSEKAKWRGFLSSVPPESWLYKEIRGATDMLITKLMRECNTTTQKFVEASMKTLDVLLSHEEDKEGPWKRLFTTNGKDRSALAIELAPGPRSIVPGADQMTKLRNIIKGQVNNCVKENMRMLEKMLSLMMRDFCDQYPSVLSQVITLKVADEKEVKTLLRNDGPQLESKMKNHQEQVKQIESFLAEIQSLENAVDFPDETADAGNPSSATDDEFGFT